ncbi:MAG: class I SAM-dependent methyltransferase [Oscillospiraceae bacterium]|nr:class I SAM-dependent methyltransferase [Oscillospiraceae bacterium]
MALSPRLRAIADLIPAGSRVADVGTDHGYLPVWLVEQGISSFVVATDVAAGPLETAKRSAERAGVLSGLHFRFADGLDAVSPDEVDTVVIAGMGGETILGIVQRAPWLLLRQIRIVLQPQSKIPELMDGLAALGYCIVDQHLVVETGKLYTIFEVTAGAMESPLDGLRYVNKTLLSRGDPLLESYLAELCDKLNWALCGLERAGEASVEKRAELTRALTDLERFRRMCGNDTSE